jgi:hypothetical protein
MQIILIETKDNNSVICTVYRTLLEQQPMWAGSQFKKIQYLLQTECLCHSEPV